MSDPTLLLAKERWETLILKLIVSGKYIFFYTLFANREMITIVKELSKEINLLVVISNISNQYEIFDGFYKMTKAGSMDFLSLIYNAQLMCTTSFHGIVFSTILVTVSKVILHVMLAYKWRYDLLTRPTMRMNWGRNPMRIRIVGGLWELLCSGTIRNHF